ncbi:potassium transport protein TRK1/TRK2 [Parathielavia appendiculata]|uniref:Potassium transport protein n=1 Tax=Parathielavia appendiculata TaxID=2587402 RepID=A0AAN6TZE3_9PEZI|nr:potassium transport protein TRK1/TRK2 [Parathielavia appendiculata]
MDGLKDMLIGYFMALKPAFISKNPHFNFISAHYFYIVGLAILGSVLVYGAGKGNLDYIDALFFASGASTQAGLNPIDINQLNTFQQIILYLWPLMTNPITIHSFVVFLRLYWFEKRFRHIVHQARQMRGTISKTKTRARLDNADAETGVNGRKITVMLNGARSRITNDGMLLEDNLPPSDGEHIDPKRQVSNSSGSDGADEAPEPRRPEIKFARTVTKSDGLGEDVLKLPQARSDQEHIAILERQRKGDDEVLRIPHPRDVERGVLPKRVVAGDDEEPEAASPRARTFSTNFDGEFQASAADNRQQAITIEEPDRRKLQQSASEDFVEDAKAAAHTFSFLKLRRPQFLRKTNRKLHSKSDEPGSSVSKGKRRQSFSNMRTAFSRDKIDGTPYLSWEPTIGRNSAFPDLTEEQREELGGIEYRSLKTLALILIGYFWIYSALGVVGLAPWILNVEPYGQIVDKAGMSRTWWAFFTASSAFMDLGFTLTPDSMNSFNTATWPLLLMIFLVIIGNTGFPVMLRFIIWVMSHIVPVGTGLYEELRFLLDHPRRCFTLLFPSGATWWLFWLLVILNGLDVLLFIVLDLNTQPVVDLPAGLKVLNGLFEAVATRTAGFSCVNIAMLHPAVQFSYMVMMYISVFPIAISVRRTNVYEEKSLGIYGGNEIEERAGQSDLSYVGAHLRRQLSFDLWYIVIGFFIITIVEGPKLAANDFTMFAVLFEVVSAYGTVGMSLGYPTVNASLCSQFSVVGKLVLIAMMIRGRHRGLPYGLDRAILLPSEALNATEAADADARMGRLPSHTSAATGGPRGSSVGRHKSTGGDHGNILTSLLHPGPYVPPEPLVPGIRRRSTEPAVDELGEPYATRVSSRRTEPGVSRRLDTPIFSHRPRTAAGGGE